MIIFEFKGTLITMEQLYKTFEKEKKEILEKNKHSKFSELNPYILELKFEISVNIFNIEQDIFFDFSIGNLFLKNILIKPIKAKIEINNLFCDFDIISSEQVDYIVRQNNILQPIIYCAKCNSKNSLIFYNFIKHSSCDNIIEIMQSVHYLEINDEKEFKNFFPLEDKIEFKTPNDFEINFNEYFNRNNFLKKTGKFNYYSNIKARKDITAFIKACNSFGKYMIFFGVQGIGKSLTIVHTLKYEIDHSQIKTFYIHCKYLGLLSKEYNNIEIRRIILSEIPYLFYNDFKSYKECVNLVKNFDFSFDKTFLDLIEKIFDYLSKKKGKYLIVFDQYNNISDHDSKKINGIIKKIINNSIISKNFVFISYMSLNNDEVKYLKLIFFWKKMKMKKI